MNIINKKIKVCLLYPTDPAGHIIGGIESFIRGLISASPEHITYYVVGATTDESVRPLKRWTKCSIKNREFYYYPLYKITDQSKRKLMPDTVKHLFYTALSSINFEDFDVIESHRIEHFLSVRNIKAYRSLFLHNTMDILKNDSSDIRWKFMPGLYFWLEKYIVNQIDSLMIVREQAATQYREKYPSKKHIIDFVPTVADNDCFYMLNSSRRLEAREHLSMNYGIDQNQFNYLGVFVGRLDSSKDPDLLIETLKDLRNIRTDFHVFVVGDGVLRDRLEEKVTKYDLMLNITFVGYKTATEVAKFFQISDFFVMTSAYEGMPIALIEAMCCGVPAITTNVGEVSKLISNNVNGFIVEGRSARQLAEKINAVISDLDRFWGVPCVDAAAPFTPEKVFSKVYARYEKRKCIMRTDH